MDRHCNRADIALRNLQFRIVCRGALAAENRAAAVFTVAIFMVRRAARSAENLWRNGCRFAFFKSHAAIRTNRLSHLVSLPFTEVKRITANLNQVSALQRAGTRRSAGNKDRAVRTEKGLRAAHLDHAMLRKNACVFEEIDIARLVAADGGERLIKKELLAGQRTGSHIQPAVFERAFHNADGNAGGKSEQAETDGAAQHAGLRGETDGIKYDAAESGAEQSAQNAVFGFAA